MTDLNISEKIKEARENRNNPTQTKASVVTGDIVQAKVDIEVKATLREVKE